MTFYLTWSVGLIAVWVYWVYISTIESTFSYLLWSLTEQWRSWLLIVNQSINCPCISDCQWKSRIACQWPRDTSAANGAEQRRKWHHARRRRHHVKLHVFRPSHISPPASGVPRVFGARRQNQWSSMIREIMSVKALCFRADLTISRVRPFLRLVRSFYHDIIDISWMVFATSIKLTANIQ